MSVTDLTGTRWYFNDTVNVYGNIYPSFNFTDAAGNEYNMIQDIGALCYVSTNGEPVVVYYTNTYWQSEDYRTITITGGPYSWSTTNATYIAWLEANATQIIEPQISDLTGTRWLINTGTFNNSAFDTTITFYINYAIPNSTNIWKDNCDALEIGPTYITLKKQSTSNNRSDITFNNERLWYIFDGKDVTNPELIAWFELNAVQQEFESEDYLTNTYDLIQVANTIRKTAKNYTLMSYPSGMVDTLNNMGDFWTIEQLMSTDNLGDLYYNGSITFIPMGAFAYKRISIAEFPNVLSIDASAFYSNYRLSSISFPNCTSIGQYVFYNCRSLTTASFPSCTTVKDYAFAYCTSLTTASFPKCTTISSYAFQYCSSLTTISFLSCTTIGAYAFYNCSSLTTASFPNCTTIGGYAFGYCYSLITISFPNCTSIGSSAFTKCSSLSTASFPNCTYIDYYAFQYCSSLTTVSFPSCAYIGNSAFQYCSSLTTVSFPSCTTIGNFAFQYCSSLINASFPKCTSIGNFAFRCCVNLTSLNLTSVSEVTSLPYSNAFSSTPIAGYTTSTGGVYGSIYVPSSLLTSFKTATNWTYFSDRMVGV